MNTQPQWPGLSAVIHHTIYRHTLITIEDAAMHLHVPVTTLSQWAHTHGITIHQTPAGAMIATADIESAVTRRSPHSRPRSRTPYRQ
ncbi:MAG: hypothetical protein RL076_2469 [Chloroflexota bacterium]|jgi:hypothetical protein